jgi:hypothetical protein
LRVFSWNRPALGSLEVSFLPPPKHFLLAKNPEVGGAIVSMRSESHYLEFNMAVSV